MCIFIIVAEEKGVEPLRSVTRLRAFQARPFSLLGIPPCAKDYKRLFNLFQ